jgi:hypothetical protein
LRLEAAERAGKSESFCMEKSCRFAKSYQIISYQKQRAAISGDEVDGIIIQDPSRPVGSAERAGNSDISSTPRGSSLDPKPGEQRRGGLRKSFERIRYPLYIFYLSNASSTDSRRKSIARAAIVGSWEACCMARRQRFGEHHD